MNVRTGESLAIWPEAINDSVRLVGFDAEADQN